MSLLDVENLTWHSWADSLIQGLHCRRRHWLNLWSSDSVCGDQILLLFLIFLVFTNKVISRLGEVCRGVKGVSGDRTVRLWDAAKVQGNNNKYLVR